MFLLQVGGLLCLFECDFFLLMFFFRGGGGGVVLGLFGWVFWVGGWRLVAFIVVFFWGAFVVLFCLRCVFLWGFVCVCFFLFFFGGGFVLKLLLLLVGFWVCFFFFLVFGFLLLLVLCSAFDKCGLHNNFH